MLTYTRNARIEWGDCDPAGIVFYPRFFALFDSCTTALFSQQLGMSKYDFSNKYNFAYPMVDTRARFLKPARYGDDVLIETWIAEFRRSSFDVHHRLLKADGELAVECFDTRVWVEVDPGNPERIRSKAIPQEVIAKFAAG